MQDPILKDRRMLPIWRSFSALQGSDELLFREGSRYKAGSRVASDEYTEKLADWRASPNIYTAVELVNAGIVESLESEITQAARFILDSNIAVTEPLKNIAAAVLIRNKEIERNVDVQEIGKSFWRRRTNEYPRDPVGWIELARLHFTDGLVERASRCMEIAIKLEPNSRFVVRAATRFFNLVGDNERAYRIIRRNEKTQFDPWLVSVEIALSALVDKRSYFLKKGIELIDSGKFYPSTLTELQASIGTEYFKDGAAKKGKKLFRSSLISPNLNSLAQAEWISTRIEKLDIKESSFRTLRDAWEAVSTRAFIEEGNIGKALVATKEWLKEEPFNIDIHVAGAIIGGIAEKYDESIEIANSGLKLDRESMKLRNSLSFSLARNGDVAGAIDVLGGMKPVEALDRNVWMANRGLCAFRIGEVESGIAFYLVAIESFKELKMPEMEASANAYFAIELARAKLFDQSKARIEEARKLNKKNVWKYIGIVTDRAEVLVRHTAGISKS